MEAHDAALSQFSTGLAHTTTVARADLDAALAERRAVANELVALQHSITERTQRLDQGLASTPKGVEDARAAVTTAQTQLTQAIADHGVDQGRLSELRRLRAAQDLTAAEETRRKAVEDDARLPVPDRQVTEAESVAAQAALERSARDLGAVKKEIHEAQGALRQVGGAVARERLRDATEAFEQAERYEREMEADCEAWKLLLEQMKDADAAQARNLGQAPAPALTAQFNALTAQRYQGVQLTAQLETEGVVVGGALKPSDRISVGTREQLSTLYRLSVSTCAPWSSSTTSSCRATKRGWNGSGAARGESTPLPDRRVHVPARRLPGRCRDAQRRSPARRQCGRLHSGGGPRSHAPVSVDSHAPAASRPAKACAAVTSRNRDA